MYVSIYQYIYTCTYIYTYNINAATLKKKQIINSNYKEALNIPHCENTYIYLWIKNCKPMIGTLWGCMNKNSQLPL